MGSLSHISPRISPFQPPVRPNVPDAGCLRLLLPCRAPLRRAPAPVALTVMSKQTDHYFTAEPASAAERRQLRVYLAGREVIVQTAPGIFCPDRVDIGTAVLLREAPVPPPSGNLLDIGSGWGPIALSLGLLSPDATIWAVDVNQRALTLARDNAKTLGINDFHAMTPAWKSLICLLYTSDAADDLTRVDLGGRRIIK